VFPVLLGEAYATQRLCHRQQLHKPGAMNQPRSPAEPEVVPATQHVAEDSKWSNFETVFTNAKAGMSGVDKDHVKRVVYEMSKVSQGIRSSLYA